MPSLCDFKFEHTPTKENLSLSFFSSGGVKKQGGMDHGDPRSKPTGTGPKKSADNASGT